mmetsp:Transcript_11848/g.26368  ORF Transcript_11848/g.26368 Transcript_11848/m.26368 type:complete len:82 (-) Transcript_11848:13-258(-)
MLDCCALLSAGPCQAQRSTAPQSSCMGGLVTSMHFMRLDSSMKVKAKKDSYQRLAGKHARSAVLGFMETSPDVPCWLHFLE